MPNAGDLLSKMFRPVYDRIRMIFSDAFGLGPGATMSAVIFSGIVVLLGLFWFFHSAPPDTLIISSGAEGSRLQKTAERYAKVLAKNGVTLKILPSEGSRENLKRLQDPSFRVDVGFVQSGMAKGENVERLVSLGSVSYQPLYLFYRSAEPLGLLSDFRGKGLAVGEEGSGTKNLALELLELNGVTRENTKILELDDDAAYQALMGGGIDAAFMMGDSASSQIMRDLRKMPDIRIFGFSQADAYTRRIGYLNKLVLLKGSMDFGNNVPEQDLNLLSPTVELVARDNLHPALSDLLLETATQVHGRSGMFQKRGEFPTPLEHEYRISDDAQRYYKSGKTFLYRYLPFWLASLVSRVLLVFVPMFLVLVPGLRVIPKLYRWRMRLYILRWYRALLALESELAVGIKPEKREELLRKLDDIEESVNAKKMPASFADQFYSLRSHIGIVRARLLGGQERPAAACLEQPGD